MRGRARCVHFSTMNCFRTLVLLVITGAACFGGAAPSKKGLQVEMVDDALALGIKHAALNFNLTPVPDFKSDTNNPSWDFNGRKLFFRRSQLDGLDRRIKQLSDAGVTVTLIVLTYQSGDAVRDAIMIHPRCI